MPLDRAAIERILKKRMQTGIRRATNCIRNRQAYRLCGGQAAAQAEAAHRPGQAADTLDRQALRRIRPAGRRRTGRARSGNRPPGRPQASCPARRHLAVVGEALAQLPHQHAAIHLSTDAFAVRSYLGDALAHAGHRILEEPAMKPGDCLLESGGSQIDATTATRWRRVIENLGYVQQPGNLMAPHAHKFNCAAKPHPAARDQPSAVLRPAAWSLPPTGHLSGAARREANGVVMSPHGAALAETSR